MKIDFVFTNKIGKRSCNEDAVYPSSNNTSANENLFMVCDGVGGANKGEVASSTVCQAIAQHFGTGQLYYPIDEGIVNAFLHKAETALDEYTNHHPESAGMATTLALLHLDRDAATIAHVGDSRVYHVRNGSILFKTQDHSLVNELVVNGHITEEEAKTHPKRNVITRAISGKAHPAKADVHIVQDLLEEDCFLLCSDGVLECIGDDFIQQYCTYEFLQTENGLKDFVNLIDIYCNQHSNDNYSAIVVIIKQYKANQQTFNKKETSWFKKLTGSKKV